ncbi:MAG TPA: CoA-binding protein [Methylomirabilota bacterium]|nr:CoA-binding protein [Methylomirabilota bacterium]
MASHDSSLEIIEDFLAQKRIALIGVSRKPGSFSVPVFQEFCRRGYDVVPVNPNASEFQGRRCFARVQDVQPPVQAALLLTSPDVTDRVVRDCAEARILRVWMHRAGGQGAVSPQAVEFCRERGIRVVPGECPLMFLPRTAAFHRLHGFIRKLTGRYPKHAQALPGQKAA